MVVVPTHPFGNCLFEALSIHLHGKRTQAANIRREVFEFIVNRYEFFMDEPELLNKGPCEYAKYMCNPETYGTHVQIRAFHLMKNITIASFNNRISNVPY